MVYISRRINASLLLDVLTTGHDSHHAKERAQQVSKQGVIRREYCRFKDRTHRKQQVELAMTSHRDEGHNILGIRHTCLSIYM